LKIKIAKNCKKLQKIELFSRFAIQLHCKPVKMRQISGRYAGFQMCTKTALFLKNCKKLQKIAKNCKKLQKIALFLEKRPYFLGNEHFWPIFVADMGTYVAHIGGIQVCTKTALFFNFRPLLY